MAADVTHSPPGCTLCTRPGDFGRHDHHDPYAGLCPRCVAAGRPTRDALERSVVIVARQHLVAAEDLELGTATPEEMTYHLGTLKRSLRSLLQLITPDDQLEEGAW